MNDEFISFPPQTLSDGRIVRWVGFVDPVVQPTPEPEDPEPEDPEPEDPEPEDPERRSGLAWDSGVFANDNRMPAAWEAMRGRLIDVADVHCDAEDVNNSYWVRSYTPQAVGSLNLSCPLTAAQSPSVFREAGRIMASAGFAGPLARIRPGVEFNLDNSSAATTSGWRKWADRFIAAAKEFTDGAGEGAHVCLCPNEGTGSGKISKSATESLVQRVISLAKEAGIVVEIGVDFYDQWEPMFTDDAFEERIASDTWGSLGWWADVADDFTVRISVPEWGCGRIGGQWGSHAGGDNSVFITNMINWFKSHAAVISYEAYFAEPASYIACDLTTQMPNSRAAYKAALNN